MLSSIAEQERLTIRKRQREGIDAAKKKGKHLGRPITEMPAGFGEMYREWEAGRITARWAMKQLGLKSSTYYRLVRKYEKG